MIIDYEKNDEKKEIDLQGIAMVLSNQGNTKYDILVETLEEYDVSTIEYMVLHDLIYYLSKGNFIGNNKEKTFRDKKPLLLSKKALEKNLSGKTNTTGATLFLIENLKEYNAPQEEVSILSGILQSMLDSKKFIGSSNPLPIIQA